MKLGKTVILSLLILFTFVGNIGFSVFTHSCKKDGVSRAYIVNSQNHCENEAIEELPPCCQKESKKSNDNQSTDAKFKDDCCNDEVDVFKINLDYFSQYEVHIPATPIELQSKEYFYIFKNIAPIKYHSNLTIHPPPLPSGKQILIKHQVFRI